MRRIVLGTGPHVLGERGMSLRSDLGQVLATSIGAEVEVVALGSYAELLRAVSNLSVQVAWLPPALFVHSRDLFGVTAIASAVRADAASYCSSLFVVAESDIRGLDDLRGKSVAWVDPDSCSGYLFPRLALHDRGVDPDAHLGEQSFHGSHAAVARAVANGRAEVGATYVNTAAEKGAERIVSAGWGTVAELEAMRPVLRSETIPSDVICVVEGLEMAWRDKLIRALVELHELPVGQEVLEGLFEARRFAAAESARYDVVRRAIRGPTSSSP